jgi:PAS domain S-box-containing protein
LVFLSGALKGRRVPLRPGICCIGRDPSCEVVLNDQSASRTHVEVRFADGRLTAHDLGSTNGTFVNNKQIKEVELRNGDRLAVGDTTLLVALSPAAPPAPPQVVISEDQENLTPRASLRLDETRLLKLRKEDIPLPDARRKVEHLCEFISLVSRVLHLPALLERSLERLVETFQADRGGILLLDADGQPVRQTSRTRAGPDAGQTIAIPRALLQQVVKTRQSHLWEEAQSGAVAAGKAAGARAPTRSILGIPLQQKDRLTGLLYLDRAPAQPRFTETDLELCTAMASHLAVCLENARLYAEVLDAAEFNNSMLRSMAGGVLAADLTGRVTHVNRAALEILGLDEAAILHRNLSEMPALRGLAAVIHGTLDTGKPQDRFEVTLQTRADPVPLGLTTALLTDHAGRKVGVVANFRNLAMLRRLEDQLRETKHLAALGQMAAGVAHEIRNPLNSVRGFSQLILEQAARKCAEKRCGEYAQVVIEEVDRMNRIVQDLLDYSRQRDLTLRPLHLERVLRHVAKDMEPDFQKARVAVDLKAPESPPPCVLGHADKLRQVFHNILLNALQASSAGGRVAVAIGANDVAAGTRREVAVAVSDQGVGIAPEVLPRIFDPFFTLKDVGTGLGLSITQKIVHEHGGRIEVESQLGKGSTFTIFLPAV